MIDTSAASSATWTDSRHTYLRPIGPVLIGVSITAGTLTTAAMPLQHKTEPVPISVRQLPPTPRVTQHASSRPKVSEKMLIELAASDPRALADMLVHADMTPGLRRSAPHAGVRRLIQRGPATQEDHFRAFRLKTYAFCITLGHAMS